MADGAADVDAISSDIRRYLIDHPDAADTLEGVALWWLSGNVGDAFLAAVHEALRRLVVSGDAAARTMIDGTVIYEGIGANGESLIRRRTGPTGTH
jgi:hypothetical protein